MPSKTINIVATTDLVTDQRLQKTAATLSAAGYEVTLLGRLLPQSRALTPAGYQQVRLKPWFLRGQFFYMGWQVQILFWLLTNKASAVVAVDMDTLPGAWLATRFSHAFLVLDAHELFSEQEEVIRRPAIQKVWAWVEKWFGSRVDMAYTVSGGVAKHYAQLWQKPVAVVRNLPLLAGLNKTEQTFDTAAIKPSSKPYLLYVGALNANRGLETSIMSLHHHGLDLVICGDGPDTDALMQLAKDQNLQDRVLFTGRLSPEDLVVYYENAYLGLLLLTGTGLNYQYSLANKFFDYMVHGLPQLVVPYAEYEHILKAYPFGKTISTTPEGVAAAVLSLLADPSSYNSMKEAALVARKELCWEHESTKLVALYDALFAQG